MSVESLIADLGYGGSAGFVVGYAARRVLNILFMFLGLYLLSLLWLQSKGVIDIHWSAFLNLFKSIFESTERFVAFSGAFLGGFFLGSRA